MGLSKKHPEVLCSPLWLLAAPLLHAFPGVIPPGAAREAAQAAPLTVLGSLLFLGIHHLLGPWPRPFRFLFLVPLALPVPELLRFWPSPWTPMLPLFSWALLLHGSLGNRPRALLAVPALLGAAWLHLLPLTTLPAPPELDPLRGGVRMLLGALLLLPGLFCFHPILRPTGRLSGRILFCTPFATAIVLPLLWLAVSTAKTPSELARHPYSLHPLPRYQAFANEPASELPPSAIVSLGHLLSPISPTSLLSFFDEAPLPPSEMIRAFQVYGLLQRDRHGYHVPETTFSGPLPPEISPEYQAWILRFRSYASFTAEEVGPDFALLRDRGLLAPVPAMPGRFRLTVQARHPLADGWLPRQILAARGDTRHNVDEYAARHGLTPARAHQELQALADAGHLKARPFVPAIPPLSHWGLALAALLLSAPGARAAAIPSLLLLPRLPSLLSPHLDTPTSAAGALILALFLLPLLWRLTDR